MQASTREELLVTWRALRSSVENTGWSWMHITSSASFNIMAGVEQPQNLESLIIFFPSLPTIKSTGLPQANGFFVSCEKLDSKPGRWIVLSRSPAGQLDMFATMATDIIHSLITIRNHSEAQNYQELIGRIKAWQAFMRPDRSHLTSEEELGLMGELSCLENLITAGVAEDVVLSSWVGPDGGIQDFHIGSGAIEVKSTLSQDGFIAKIQSLDQLDDGQRNPMFVIGCRFSLSEHGETLPMRVERILTNIINSQHVADRFTLLLLRAGYHKSHAEHYFRKFTNPEIYIWLVTDAFPRLTQGTVPAGVRSASYSIDLMQANSQAVNSIDEVILRTGAGNYGVA